MDATLNGIFSGGLSNPTITICNINRIRQSEALKYGLDEELLAYLFNDPFAQHLVTYPWGESKGDVGKRFAQWRKRHNFNSTKQIYQTLGHQCNDTIIVLNDPNMNDIRLNVCDNPRLANVTHVVPVMTSIYGLCYRVVLADSVDFTPPGGVDGGVGGLVIE